MASKVVRPIRIIALPLTRPTPKSNGLTYYQFQLKARQDTGKPKGRVGKLLTTAQTKAADTWSGFGKANEGTWKVSSVAYTLSKNNR
jgi:hypothetical protein